MRTNRLSFALSATALVVALFGATPVGSAAQSLTVAFAKNAAQVGGFKPSKTSKKNTVVVRGANGKIDQASLPVIRGQRGEQGLQGVPGPPGQAGQPGERGPEGPANPNAVSAQNADRLDSLDSVDFIRSNAVFGGDVSGPFSDLQIGADKVGTAEVAPNSLTGADVLDSSIGGADITSSSVPGTDLSADSVTGGQIVETTLAQVPSAANASTVDGQSALTFNFNVGGSSVEPPPVTTLFTLGGMTMSASCETVLAAPSIDELQLFASTDANNSYIRSTMSIPNDADWDIGEQPDGGSQWFDSRGDAAGLVVYRRSNTSGSTAQVISIILAWNTHLNGCMLSGTVLGH